MKSISFNVEQRNISIEMNTRDLTRIICALKFDACEMKERGYDAIASVDDALHEELSHIYNEFKIVAALYS